MRRPLVLYTIDTDVTRPMVRTRKPQGKQVYKNCLGYALRSQFLGRKIVDVCALFCLGVDGSSFEEIIQALCVKLGTSRLQAIKGGPEQACYNAPAISHRNLIGVGIDTMGNLHFYVVTRTNGDGQGISGTNDAKNNKVLPCRLRGGTLKQFQEIPDDVQKTRRPDHYRTPADYKFLGYCLLTPKLGG